MESKEKMLTSVKLNLALSLFIWGSIIVLQGILFSFFGREKIYTFILKHWRFLLLIILVALSTLVLFDIVIVVLYGYESVLMILKSIYTFISVIFLIRLAKEQYALLLQFRFMMGAIHLLALNSMLALLHANKILDIALSIVLNTIPYVCFEVALRDPPVVLVQEMNDFNEIAKKIDEHKKEKKEHRIEKTHEMHEKAAS